MPRRRFAGRRSFSLLFSSIRSTFATSKRCKQTDHRPGYCRTIAGFTVSEEPVGSPACPPFTAPVFYSQFLYVVYACRSVYVIEVVSSAMHKCVVTYCYHATGVGAKDVVLRVFQYASVRRSAAKRKLDSNSRSLRGRVSTHSDLSIRKRVRF